MVETWQAGPDGTFGEGFRGFGRAPTDADGALGDRHAQARAASATARRRTSTSRVLARGLLNRVVTRIYFADEAEANAADPVLSALTDGAARDADRRAPATATASTSTSREPHETAFFRL